MGAEISIYDGETDEEIALLESKISMTSMDYEMRFRYKEDKYTFSRRSIWKNMEFEWRNEAEQEMMRLKQQWNWFKSEIFANVNTQLTKDDDLILLPVLGVVLMYYYTASKGT